MWHFLRLRNWGSIRASWVSRAGGASRGPRVTRVEGGVTRLEDLAGSEGTRSGVLPALPAPSCFLSQALCPRERHHFILFFTEKPSHGGERNRLRASPAPPQLAVREAGFPRGREHQAGMASWRPGVNGSRFGGWPPGWWLKETAGDWPNTRAFTRSALLFQCKLVISGGWHQAASLAKPPGSTQSFALGWGPAGWVAGSGQCGGPDDRHLGPLPSRQLLLRWHSAHGPPARRLRGGRGQRKSAQPDGVPGPWVPPQPRTEGNSPGDHVICVKSPSQGGREPGSELFCFPSKGSVWNQRF